MKNRQKFRVENTDRAKLQASRSSLHRFCKQGFGLSVHWGTYSLSTSGNEWIYYTDRIPFETCHRRMENFNPVRSNADELAKIADPSIKPSHTWIQPVLTEEDPRPAAKSAAVRPFTIHQPHL